MSTNVVHVGVDVGGTNTDAVVLGNGDVLGWSKQITTADITTGVIGAVSSALDCAAESRREGQESVRFGSSIRVKRVHIGTTHFVNAVLQKQHLVPVAVIRLSGPVSNALPPFSYFPKDLENVIAGPTYMVGGGFYFDGKKHMSLLNKEEIHTCLNTLKSLGISHIVVSGVFSPVNNEQELQVGEWIKELFPKASFTLSHEVAQLGILLRENSAVLNESLKPLSEKTFMALQEAFRALKLHCPFYLTQNDGTLLSTDMAMKYPVLTFASGPTNSMRGALFLSGVKDGIVLDIGGTSTEIGVLQKGFPRPSSSKVEVGGVMTSFQMPDTLSIALGGGSFVRFVQPEESQEESKVLIGPKSVGSRLRQESVVFGGKTLTATDVAVAEGLSDLGTWEDHHRAQWLPHVLSKAAIKVIHHKIEEAVDRIKTSSEAVPVILVGGGSIILDLKTAIHGATKVIRPEHYQVANAVGAALSQTSAVINRLEVVTVETEEKVVEEIKEEAIKLVINKGADPNTVEILDVLKIPVTYIPGNFLELRVKAVGNILFTSPTDEHLEGVSWQGSQPIVCPDIEITQTFFIQKHKHSSLVKTEAEINTVMESFTINDDNTEHIEPNIDPDTGEWLLSPYDIECLAIGAGILGCGGGGNPLYGKLWALKQLSNGKKMRVVNPKRFARSGAGKQYVITCVYMGAPTIVNEMLLSAVQSIASAQALIDLYNMDEYNVETGVLNSNDLNIEEDNGVTFIADFKKPESSVQSNGRKIGAVCAVEVAGLNSMTPLIIGSQLDLPVLDCDLMGRAFPELQMCTSSIYGENLYPMALGDIEGRKHLCLKASSSKQLEDHCRMVTVKMGCCSSTAFRPLPASVIIQKTVLNSTSRAWMLGKAVINSRRQKSSPINAILQFENGIHICNGKISELQRQIEGGFAKGEIKIEGLDEFASQTYIVYFQNENIVVKNIDEEDKVIASVPDLISIVDLEMGEPIATDELRYGLRIAVLALPAPPILRTPKALAVVGPSAFGYKNIEYKSVGEYLEHLSIPPE